MATLPVAAGWPFVSVTSDGGVPKILVSSGFKYLANVLTFQRKTRIFNVDGTFTDVDDRPQGGGQSSINDLAAIALVNGDVLTIGQDDEVDFTSKTFLYDIGAGTWTQKADFPGDPNNAFTYFGFATSDGGAIAFENLGSVCAKWDPVGDIWTAMSFPLGGLGSWWKSGGCALPGGKFFAVRNDNTTSSSDNLRWSLFDGVAWSAVATHGPFTAVDAGYTAHSVSRSDVVCTPLANGNVLVLLSYTTDSVAGDRYFQVFNRAFVFDSEELTFTSVPGPTTPRISFGATGSFGCSCYVAGGLVRREIPPPTCQGFFQVDVDRSAFNGVLQTAPNLTPARCFADPLGTGCPNAIMSITGGLSSTSCTLAGPTYAWCISGEPPNPPLFKVVFTEHPDPDTINNTTILMGAMGASDPPPVLVLTPVAFTSYMVPGEEDAFYYQVTDPLPVGGWGTLTWTGNAGCTGGIDGNACPGDFDLLLGPRTRTGKCLSSGVISVTWCSC